MYARARSTTANEIPLSWTFSFWEKISFSPFISTSLVCLWFSKSLSVHFFEFVLPKTSVHAAPVDVK